MITKYIIKLLDELNNQNIINYNNIIKINKNNQNNQNLVIPIYNIKHNALINNRIIKIKNINLKQSNINDIKYNNSEIILDLLKRNKQFALHINSINNFLKTSINNDDFNFLKYINDDIYNSTINFINVNPISYF
jgi:hypothetical protein